MGEVSTLWYYHDMQEILFATTNQGKAVEAEAILGIPVEIVSLEIDEIQDLDPKRIVRKKAEEAFKRINRPLIVDDVSVRISAWGNFPGPFIKFLLNENNKLFRRLLKYEKDRRGTVITTIGYHDGKNIHIFTGHIEGLFLLQLRGSNGFGFDALFKPEGSIKTFAEMTIDEKNKISHRSIALKQLKKYLTTHSQ